MTGLYWTAAVLALLWAGYTGMRLRRGRSALMVASSLCMASAAAALGAAAVWPGLLGAGPAHPVIAWLMISLGLLAAWTFLGVLAAASGQSARPLALVAVPLAAAAAARLVLALAPDAGTARLAARDAWSIPVLASQCLMAACYCPAEVRITVIAWRFAGRVRVRHVRWGMRAVAAGAAAELALILARAAMVTSDAAGGQAAGRAAAPIAAAQGAAVISILAGTTASAWFPPLARLARQAWLWAAYWRLRPLWAALRRVITEVPLTRPPGTGRNLRYRLDRRVIEIRDAQLALRAYAPPDVPGRAEVAARSAGLDPGKAVAVAEAAVIAAALAARRSGQPPRRDRAPEAVTGIVPDNDLRAEAARLIAVSRAFRHSPVVRRITGTRQGTAHRHGRLLRLPHNRPPGSPAPGASATERLLENAEETAGRRAGRGQWPRPVTRPFVDQRRERLRFPLLIRAVHAAAHDELDELRIDLGCQQAGQPSPDLRAAAVAQHHVRRLMQRDVILVVGGGAFLVIQQVLSRRADPHAARHARPGPERAQPDRPPPPLLQPGDELGKIERCRDINLLDDGGGMPPFRACAHCSPQYPRRDSRQEPVP